MYEFFGYLACQTSVGPAHFCSMEVVVCLEGEMLVLGIPVEKVPGANAKDKRAFIYHATIDSLTPLVVDSGFLVRVGCQTIAVSPTGFLFVRVALKPTIGLRWSLSADSSDRTRMSVSLREQISSFPELRSPKLGLVGCLEFMDSDV